MTRWLAISVLAAGCASAPPPHTEPPAAAVATPAHESAPPSSARAEIERYERQGRWSDVARASEHLLEHERGAEDDFDRVLRAYAQLGAHEKATALLLGLVGEAPDDEERARRYRQLAEVATLAGDARKAREYSRQSLMLDSRPAALVALAELFELRQESKPARRAYQSALMHDARNVAARFALARLDEFDQRLADAAAHYDVLLRSHDRDVIAKAGERAIALAELLRTLPELEARLALLGTPPHRLVLVALYALTDNVQRLEELAQFDRDGEVRRAARDALSSP